VDDLGIVVSVRSGDAWRVVPPYLDQLGIGGRVFTDGSCMPSCYEGVARAGWAFVVTNQEGDPVAEVSGAVGRGLPQTAPVAEWVAAQVALQFSEAPTTIVSDCNNVVVGLGKILLDKGSFRDHRLRGVGFMKSIATDLRGKWLAASEKIKAHTAILDTDDLVTRSNKFANMRADLLAKEGARRHTAPPEDFYPRLDHVKNVIKNIFALAGALLQEYPKESPERCEKPAGFKAAKVWQVAGGHKWAFAGEGFACSGCGRFVADRQEAAKVRACRGLFLAEAVLAKPNGHTLVLIVTDLGSTFLCASCGHFATTVPRKLAQPCSRHRSRGGVVAFSRVDPGRHPEQRNPGRAKAIFPIGQPAPFADGEWAIFSRGSQLVGPTP